MQAQALARLALAGCPLPHVVQPPELQSRAPSSMTRGPEDGHQGPSWVKQTPLSVEKLCAPTATSFTDVGADPLPTHPTVARFVQPFRERLVTLSTLYPNPTWDHPRER